jgi:2-dehydro-3-deoxyphosphogluconate aldolase / (4S)-4-hydroxy-2-oxoglutarate aldolase
MDTPSEIIRKIKQQRMMPLYYHDDETVCIEVAKALYAAGVRIIEFANRGDAALKNFAALVEWRNHNCNDLLLSAGTIKNGEEADSFISAGADFLISPFFDSSVCETAKRKNIFWIPGCMTPTEIHTAVQAGCRLIKLYPGNVLGSAFVSAIRDVFPGIDFMPTGGVEITAENLQQWFNAGVCAVGMGSKLITKKLLQAKDYTAIEENTRMALSILQTIN